MTAMTAPELQLPWESTGEEDGRFQKILRNMLAALMVVGLLVPWLPVQEILRVEREQLAPHLARVILEKKELPQPDPVQVKPRPVLPKVKSKPQPVPRPKPVPPPEQTLEKAMEVAQVSGVLAFRDDLIEMRDSLDLDALSSTQTSRGEARAASVERSLITSAARMTSGGINGAVLSRDAGGAALSGRETTRVRSAIAGESERAQQSQSALLGGRSDESIRREMDRNKGAIFAIYNRALRRDPLLEGKLVFEMVIAATGEVDEVKLLSSELDDDALTRKILSRIRLIRFEKEDVVSTRVNYSFDFLPYT